MRTPRHRSSRRGFALLLVLIIVSFAAAIAVLFLLSAKQERSGTDSYAQGSRVRQLADTAVNIVIGQINTATREGTSGNPISWASQPGMIRTYDTTGSLSRAYKLYSWNHMIEGATSGAVTTDPSPPSPAFNPATSPAVASPAEFPPNNWNTLTSQYTDLNAPVWTSNPGGAPNPVLVYPIMDPSIANFTTASFTAAPSVTAGSVNWDFPRELSVATDAGGYYSYAVNGTTYPLPMPVQWLYVLQDGTWTYPTSANGGIATFDNTTGVSSTNPIVGRVAFWTDDETCKVNLNTAGEGAYWDWPKAATQDEMQFAGNPPAKNEFYRISGHPASTSLSAIFPELMGTGLASASNGFPRWNYGIAGTTAGSSANATFIKGLNALMSGMNSANTTTPGLSPRYSFGAKSGGNTLTGSRGGTYPAPYYQTYNPPYQSTANSAPIAFIDSSALAAVNTYSPVPLNTYRLYATPDELFFSPPVNYGGNQRGGSNPSNVAATASQGFENPALHGAFVTPGLTTPMTPLQLAQRGFLMTTLSKAPETTLFNTPRVSLWPITWPYQSSYFVNDNATGTPSRSAPSATALGLSPQSNNLGDLAALTAAQSQWITPQEDLIAFCSTLNAAAPTANHPNAGIYTNNVALPYYFQRQSCDSPTNDWTKITRNQNLANYIRGEIHQKVPGFGYSLESGWGATNSDWIALECLDFCRSMVNQTTPNANDATGSYLYSFTGIATSGSSGNGTSYNDRNAYTSVPLRITPAGSGTTSNFKGTPPTNTSDTAAPSKSAYVTEGSFPSLREVAIMFYATQRQMPVYMGPVGPVGGAAANTPVPGHNNIADPFYWANLINPGTAYGGIAPPAPGALPLDGSDGGDTALTPPFLPFGPSPLRPPLVGVLRLSHQKHTPTAPKLRKCRTSCCSILLRCAMVITSR